jgi:uncharacterized protein YbaR (Trm112 family)
MNPRLLDYLCDPVDGSSLTLAPGCAAADGQILSGELRSAGGRTYPIVHGIPRMIAATDIQPSAEAFGEEWNHFNYDAFKANWLKHIANGAFGSLEFFKDKVVVDAAAGSGMHSKWISEAGAEYVIALELSGSVDGVLQQNLQSVPNIDIVQCSIDAPPIKRESIHGLVYCNAAIQHTPSVRKTANALWALVGDGGEFSFSCYLKYPNDPVWMIRWLLVYRPLRAILSRCSFKTRLAYAQAMARLRLIPVLGVLLERALFLVRGDVPPGERYEQRVYSTTVLNTFDFYGSNSYQHQLSAQELADICNSLRPVPRQILNLEAYYHRPLPPGLPLRLQR